MRTVPQRHVWGARGSGRPRSGGARRNGSAGGTTNVYIPPNSSAGSDSLHGSPQSDSVEGAAIVREPSGASSAPGSYIPPPPPGYAYSIVPASSPAAMIVSGPGGTAHMPYPLPRVQENLPVSPREYDQQDSHPWLMQGDSPDVPYMEGTGALPGGSDAGARSGAYHTAAYPAHVVLDSNGRGSAQDSAFEEGTGSVAYSEGDEVPEMEMHDARVAVAMRSTLGDSGMLDSSFLGTNMQRPLINGEAGPVAEQVRSTASTQRALMMC